MTSLYDFLYDGMKNPPPVTPYDIKSMVSSKSNSGKSFNTTPIPLIGEDDDRPAVCDLINKHSSKIKQVCEILKSEPLFDPEKHDELWVLRYILSQKDAKKAAKAAKATLEFRKKYKVDELGDIRHHWLEKYQYDKKEKIGLYAGIEEDSFLMSIPDSNRGVIHYVRSAGFDFDKVLKVQDEDTSLMGYILLAEWLFQMNDEVTRRTGRLTKTLKVVNMKGFNFREVNHPFLKRDGKMNKILQDIYPQSTGSALVINAPVVFESIMVFLRPFFPKRLVEKVNVVNPNKRPKDLNFFTKYVSKDNLPEIYGGKPGNELAQLCF